MTITFRLDHVVSIDPQTQEFLREIVQVVTPADLQAVNNLSDRIMAAHSRLDLIDSKLNPTPTTQE